MSVYVASLVNGVSWRRQNFGKQSDIQRLVNFEVHTNLADVCSQRPSASTEFGCSVKLGQKDKTPFSARFFFTP